MHVTIGLQPKGETRLEAVLHWLEAKKKMDLRTPLGKHASSEEGRIYGGITKCHGPPKMPSICAPCQRGK